MSRIIMPIPCHFKTPAELCDTTVARMRGALATARPGDLLFLTGDVPYAPQLPTLGSLMREWLVQNGVPAESLQLIKGGVGMFSEARVACKTVSQSGAREVVVVSSGWYLFAGKPIWRRRAKENNTGISFVSIPRTGGLRTRLLYGCIGVVVRAGIAAGLEKPLERFFTSVQKNRTKGFTLNGCA